MSLEAEIRRIVREELDQRGYISKPATYPYTSPWPPYQVPTWQPGQIFTVQASGETSWNTVERGD